MLSPSQYGDVSTYELLRAAGRGVVPADHRFLRAIVEHPEKSVPDLVRYGLEHHDERVDLTYDLIRIAHHLKAKEMVPFLIKVVREHAAGIEDFLIQAFQSAGEAAVEPLLELYREIGKDADSDVAFLLAALGVRDSRIFEALIEYSLFDAVDGSHCLAAYGDPAAIPAMDKAAGAASEPWEQGSIRDSIERLRKPEPSEPDEPYNIWDDYPEEALPSFDDLSEDELMGFLASPEPDYRAIAINTLGVEQAERHADRLFELARQDADANVRACCWQALSAAWERNDIRDAVRARSVDTNAPVVERAGAAITLAQCEAESAPLQPLLRELYEHPETPVRSRVLRAMSATLDTRYEPYIVRHLDDADPLVVLEAIQAVGILEISTVSQKLTRFFSNEDQRVSALGAYALSAPSPVTRRSMRELYQKVDRLAGGLDKFEDTEVKNAINIRLARYEVEPLFDDQGELIEEPPARSSGRVGRNDPCPCGSGKKYKKCCGAAA